RSGPSPSWRGPLRVQRSARSLSPYLGGVDALGDRQRREGLRDRFDPADDGGHRGLVDGLGDLLDGLREIRDLDLVLAVADVQDGNRHAVRDPLRLLTFFVHQTGQTAPGALADDDDPAATDCAVDGLLGLRVDA